MNYKPVVAGNQTNSNAGTKTCDDAVKARMQIVPGKDYILLPIWPADSLFSQDSKSSPDAGFKPSGEEEKKDAKDLGNESGNPTEGKYSKAPKVNVVDLKRSIELLNDPNMPELEDIVYSDDAKDICAKADMNNLDTFMPGVIVNKKDENREDMIEQVLYLAEGDKGDILLVQEYLNDIIYAYKEDNYAFEFEKFDGIRSSNELYVNLKFFPFQVNPKSLHLHALKRIFRYLKGQPKLGLWYKDSPFDLVAYTDSDYARASLDRKSTTGVQIQALVDKKKVDSSLEQYIEVIFHKEYAEVLKTTARNEFSSTMCSAVILFLDKQVKGMSKHKEIYVTPSHTKKVFANMKRQGKYFFGRDTPLFPTMIVQAQEQPSRKQRKDIKDPQLSGPTEPVTDDTENMVGRFTRVVSFKDEGLGDQEDASKQGRKIDEIDQDAKVTLVDETQGRYGDNLMFATSVLDKELLLTPYVYFTRWVRLSVSNLEPELIDRSACK
ncbi:hypothetical protein Tco_0368809 [Tanacetum coccineum]